MLCLCGHTRAGDGLDPYKPLLSTPWTSEAYSLFFYRFSIVAEDRSRPLQINENPVAFPKTKGKAAYNSKTRKTTFLTLTVKI